MVMIATMFKLAIFILCVGVVLSLLVFLPITVYTIPYNLWIGAQYNIGKQHDKKKEGVFSSAKNATKLYKAWILRQKPTL